MLSAATKNKERYKMDNLTMLNLVIGFLSPILVSVVVRPGFDARLKIAVMAATSIVFGFASAYLAGQFNGVDITTAILVTAVASITAYEGVYKPSGAANALTVLTSPKEPQKASQPLVGGRVEARINRLSIPAGNGKHRAE
jgi:small basic protein